MKFTQKGYGIAMGIQNLQKLHSQFLSAQLSALMAICELNSLDRKLCRDIFNITELDGSLLAHATDEQKEKLATIVTSLFSVVLPTSEEIANIENRDILFSKSFSSPLLTQIIHKYTTAQLHALTAIHSAIQENAERAELLFDIKPKYFELLKTLSSTQIMAIATRISWVFAPNSMRNRNIISDGLSRIGESSLYADSLVIHKIGEIK